MFSLNPEKANKCLPTQTTLKILLFKCLHFKDIVEPAQEDAVHPEEQKIPMIPLDRGQGQDRNS